MHNATCASTIENGIDKVKEDIKELDQKIENGIDKVKEDSKELDQKIEKVMSLTVEKNKWSHYQIVLLVGLMWLQTQRSRKGRLTDSKIFHDSTIISMLTMLGSDDILHIIQYLSNDDRLRLALIWKHALHEWKCGAIALSKRSCASTECHDQHRPLSVILPFAASFSGP